MTPIKPHNANNLGDDQRASYDLKKLRKLRADLDATRLQLNTALNAVELVDEKIGAIAAQLPH